jgi:hypothetical protein
MSGPDLIDERFDELVRELRSGETTASQELRERVRAIARGRPEALPAVRIGRFQRRRVALVLVPVAAALAAAVGFGLASSSGEKSKQANGAERGAVVSPGKAAPPLPSANATQKPVPGLAPSPLPPSGSRAQFYGIALRLRVSNLSATTKRAIRLTRGFGGYVVTVDYGSGQNSGTAHLVLRVPIVKVQTAVATLSSLGTITDEHVSIQDVQGQLNRRFSQIKDLEATIAGLRARLTDTTLTSSARAFFQATLARRLAELTTLQEQQKAEKTRTNFATVSLDLDTKKAAAVRPTKRGRIGQALHNIGNVLVTEAEVLLYVLLIAAPFVLVAGLLLGGRRTLRRRSENQLLAR